MSISNVYSNLNKLETTNIAKKISATIQKGDIILLHGNIGAGKTFFVNKLCSYLNVKSVVNSPSYVLLNEYVGQKTPPCPPQRGGGVVSPQRGGGSGTNESENDTFSIYHYDLYRLKTADDAIELGILDRLNDGVTIIEWPELIKNYLPKKRIEIFFEHNKNLRNIIVEDSK